MTPGGRVDAELSPAGVGKASAPSFLRADDVRRILVLAIPAIRYNATVPQANRDAVRPFIR